MSWLVRDGEVLASLEVCETRRSRSRGLLGREGFDEAMLLLPARAVHTIGMKFAIDVAFLDRDLVVLCTVTMPRWRIGRPRLRASSVLEAGAGSFAQWNLQPGDRLEIKG